MVIMEAWIENEYGFNNMLQLDDTARVAAGSLETKCNGII
jgi:hypothetical protein